jgi:hypothetical protein
MSAPSSGLICFFPGLTVPIWHQTFWLNAAHVRAHWIRHVKGIDRLASKMKR